MIKGERELFAAIAAALAFAIGGVAVAVALFLLTEEACAGTRHCYTVNGKYFCCYTVGNNTDCY